MQYTQTQTYVQSVNRSHFAENILCTHYTNTHQHFHLEHPTHNYSSRGQFVPYEYFLIIIIIIIIILLFFFNYFKVMDKNKKNCNNFHYIYFKVLNLKKWNLNFL